MNINGSSYGEWLFTFRNLYGTTEHEGTTSKLTLVDMNYDNCNQNFTLFCKSPHLGTLQEFRIVREQRANESNIKSPAYCNKACNQMNVSM